MTSSSGPAVSRISTVFLVGDSTASGQSFFTDSYYGGGGSYTRILAASNPTTFRMNQGADLNQTVTSMANYAVMGGVFDESSSSVSSYNGTIVTGNAGNSQSQGVTLGCFSQGVYYLKGDLGEVVIYSQALSTSNRQAIEGYLAWRWGLQANLPVSHPYYSAPPSGACSATLSESNSTSDSLARVAGFGRGDSESNTASDAIARLGVFGRVGSEINPASDAMARLAGFGRSDSESNIASDAMARSGAFGRTDSESNMASDAVGRVGVFGRGSTEANIVFDSLARAASYGRGDSENNAASDSISRVAAFSRHDLEIGSVFDSLGRGFHGTRAAFETLLFSDWASALHRTILLRHKLAVPGQDKSGSVPGGKKTGAAPVH